MHKDAFESAGVPPPNNNVNEVNKNQMSKAQEACKAYAEAGLSYLFWKVSTPDMLAGLGKGPKEKGWQRMEYGTPPDGGHYQIGIKVGTPLKKAEGVPQGREGLFLCCIDVDDPRLQEIAEAALPATEMRGGKKSTPRSHLFYVTDKPCNTFKWALPGVDGEQGKCVIEIFGVTRSGESGHQIVAYPSTHFKKGEGDAAATCQPYVWDKPKTEDGVFQSPGAPALTTPEELFQACSRVAAASAGAVLVTGKGLPPAWVPAAGDAKAREAADAAALASAAPESRVWKMSRGELERVILTAYSRVAALTSGNRQTGLNREAFTAASVLAGANAPEDLYDVLTGRLIAAMDELTEPFGNEKIWCDTVFRAVKEGRAKPRRRIALQSFLLTPQGTADLLTHEWKDDFRYVTEWKQWLMWDGNRWEPILKADIERYMAQVFRWAVGEAADSPNEGFRKNAVTYYFKAESGDMASTLSRMLTSQERKGMGLSISASQLNLDPWSFCCANGTFDIMTGKLRESRREDLNTQASPYRYIEGAVSRGFTRALEYAYSDHKDAEALKAYMLSWLGYCMTGSNEEQKLVVIYGNGCNGKSKTFEAVNAVAGDYGCLMAKAALIKTKDDSRNSDEVAALCGKRFGFFSESNPMDFLDEGRVKSITGAKTVTAMRKYEKEFTFPVTCKLNMDTNYKPRIRGTDDGILRRVKLVPYTKKITPEMRNAWWAEELLKAEGDGLLSMLLKEAHDYYIRGGLTEEPETVRCTGDEFAKENDLVGCFISDRCLTHATDTQEPPRDPQEIKDGGQRLYSAYQAWCKENGYMATANRMFSQRLLEKGYTTARKNTGVVWYGLELQDLGSLEKPK